MPNLNPSATETSGNQDACDFSALITLLDHYLSQGTRVSEFDLMRWLQAPERAIFRSDAATAFSHVCCGGGDTITCCVLQL